eukprot:TRINITY_DN75477_c0_g1_i1.p1 TRINITY_DN75477_c0_g1~~TRINITY_DN75477_c0_g1_i1.p1  ORF type:complete len:346 (+),score=30.91 TRINITY_DN75477_c0_g1_i1:46-1038(+)
MVRLIHRSRLEVRELIGKGQFKRVYKGKYANRDVAVLQLDEQASASELAIIDLLNEGTSFVPEVYGSCRDGRWIHLVQEWAQFGTLKHIVQADKRRTQWSTAHASVVAQQLARALAFLESKHVVHADLSCRNILCFRIDGTPENTLVKISDFGLSAVLEGDCVDNVAELGFAVVSERACSEQRRQPRAVRWCSPEAVVSNRLSHRSDVWSYGATLWEMFSRGQDPWTQISKRGDVDRQLRDLAELSKSSVKGPCEVAAVVASNFSRPEGCPVVAHSMILACLSVDEFARPTFDVLISRFDTCIPSECRDDRASCSTIQVDGSDWILADAT